MTRRKESVKGISSKEDTAPPVGGRQPRGLAQFFAESPLAGSGINLERTRDYGREVKL